MASKRRIWLAALLAIFALTGFQMLFMWSLHMHPDEELSYRAIAGSLADTLHYQQSVQDNQPPLWFVTFWAWTQGTGDHEFSGRMLGVLLTMLSMAVLYRFGRMLFPHDGCISIVAPLLLIANGFFFTYALDIRPYPMVMLCTTFSMWLFYRFVRRGTSGTALAYGATIGLMLYTHYLLGFVVIAQFLYLMVVRRFSPQWLKGSVLALALGIGVWLPWLPIFVRQVVGVRANELASGAARGIAGIGASTELTSLPTLVHLLDTATNGMVWLYALVLVLGFARLRYYRAYGLALTWALGVPMVYLTLNLVAAVYAPRYVFHALMGLALALAASLMTLPASARPLAVTGFILLNLLSFRETLPVRIPYRTLYLQMSALSQPGDAVLMRQGNEDDGFVQWQMRHYLSSELQANVTTSLVGAASAQRLWFVTGAWYDEQTRADFDNLEETHSAEIALGQCNREWCYAIILLDESPE